MVGIFAMGAMFLVPLLMQTPEGLISLLATFIFPALWYRAAQTHSSATKQPIGLYNLCWVVVSIAVNLMFGAWWLSAADSEGPDYDWSFFNFLRIAWVFAQCLIGFFIFSQLKHKYSIDKTT
jgi:hypothetical protein